MRYIYDICNSAQKATGGNNSTLTRFIPHHTSRPKTHFKEYSTVQWSVQVSNRRQLKKNNDLGQATSSNLLCNLVTSGDIHHYVIKLSSKQQLEPGFWCGPQGLPVSIACCGRCVHRLSFEGRSCKAKPSLCASVGCVAQAWSNIYGVSCWVICCRCSCPNVATSFQQTCFN